MPAEAAKEAPEYTDEVMANVGRSLMEALHTNCPNWSPLSDPAEIVVDLLNRNFDLRSVLTFYADPLKWKKENDPNDAVPVPDFYSETSFGDKATEALGWPVA